MYYVFSRSATCNQCFHQHCVASWKKSLLVSKSARHVSAHGLFPPKAWVFLSKPLVSPGPFFSDPLLTYCSFLATEVKILAISRAKEGSNLRCTCGSFHQPDQHKRLDWTGARTLASTVRRRDEPRTPAYEAWGTLVVRFSVSL